MKRQTLRKLFLFGLISLFVLLCVPYSLNAQLDKGRILSAEDQRPLAEEMRIAGQGEEEQEAEYVPGEVLVKFKEGADPQGVLSQCNIYGSNIERIHSIAAAAANFKKDYKIEKDSSSWYWFMGKSYKEVSEIPDDEAFRKAYEHMTPERKALYRKYKITLLAGLSVEEAVAQLRNNPDVESAYPNYIRQVSITFNDPQYSSQWAPPKIKAPDAWNITQGNTTETIPVEWVDMVGVSLSGTNMTKTAVTGWGNSGAASRQVIRGDGRVELSTTETNTYRMVGLSYVNTDANYTTIDYGIYPSSDGYIRVYEKGVSKGKFSTYKSGDVLVVERIRTKIYYKQNGIVIYTSAVPSTGPMIVDAALYTSGATISAARIYQPQIIAIIDTGVDYNQEDLAANIWRDGANNPGMDYVNLDTNAWVAAGWTLITGEDYTQEDNDPMDFHGHGTHCSGIAAAVSNNSKGIVGVAPKCKIMPVRAGFKIIDPKKRTTGSLTDEAIEKAVIYAVDNGATVISMSFGSYSPGDFADELRTAYAENVVLVGAAGNGNTSSMHYPSAMAEVLAVAATNQNDNKASFSNYGDWIDVAAPGVSILSTLPNNQYASWDGTSMACPHVAGLAALILSKDPGLSNSVVYQKLRTTSDDLGDLGKDIYYGYGRINCDSALNADIDISSPKMGSFVKGSITISGTASLKTGFQKYELYYAPQDNPTAKTLLKTSTTSVQNGVLGTWDTAAKSEGKYILVLQVYNSNGKTYKYTINLTVDNVSEPPAFINLNNLIAIIGRELKFEVLAIDPDDPATAQGKLNYSASGLPAGAAFNSATRIFTWTPLNTDKGSYEVTFKTQDDTHVVEKTITISTLYVEQSVIIANAQARDYPKIYKNKIVWGEDISTSYSLWNLYVYDLITTKTTLISAKKSAVTMPAVYEDKIVWQDSRNGNLDIYMYNLTSGNETRITSNSANQLCPAIYKDKIVWTDYRNGGTNRDIYMYNLSSKQETRITSNSANQEYPQIYEDKIVWQDSRNGNLDIYMYNLTKPGESRITNSSGTKAYPLIYDNKIFWTDSSTGYSPYEIHIYDLGSGKETSTGIVSAIKYKTGASGDLVAGKKYWNGNRNIYVYDLNTKQGIDIAATKDNQLLGDAGPWLFENMMVWDDFKEKLNLAKLYFVPIITSIEASQTATGRNLIIIGKNFGSMQEGGEVKLADGAACSVQGWSNNQIICALPGLVQTGEVSVTTKGGKSKGFAFDICNKAPAVVYGSWPAVTFNIDTPYTFSTLISDADGYRDIQTVSFYIGNHPYDLWIYYDRDSNQIYLYDASSGGFLGGFALGSNNVISATNGKLYCAGSSVSPSGNNIYLNLSISFTSWMIGNKDVAICATDFYSSSEYVLIGSINIVPISPVAWCDMVGVSLTGTTLKKTAATGWGNSGAASQQSFAANGGVQFTTSETNTYRMVGLSYTNVDTNFTSIKYGVYPSADGYIRVYESGVYKGKFATYATGDIISVERVGTTVYYKKNGATFYTSATSSSGTMIVDAALYTSGATIVDAKIFY